MWEIFTFGGGDSLVLVFSAISALTNTTDFIALVRLLLIATGLFVAIEVAFTARLQPMPRILTFVFIFYVGFVLDTDVQITDRTDPTANATVADVPVGIAVPASFISTIGDWATRSFDTLFSLPNDIQYSQNGMLMATRLLESTNDWYPADSRFATNLQNFMGDCVQYGALVGWFSWTEILMSEDLWGDIGIWGLGSGIFTEYTNAAGVTILLSCNLAYTAIDGEWTTASDDTADVFGQKFFPKQNPADASTRLKASLPVAWTFLAGVSSSASELIQQQVVLNIFKRSASTMAAQSGATGAMQDYALAMAQAQQRNTYQTLGALAGRTIILIHNIFEVIIYGIFPLALLMVMVSIKQGQNLLLYIKSILWLQLWAPLFSILNFVATFYAVGTTTGAANYIDTGTLSTGLNLLTSMDIASSNADISAMAGYLAWMIPILAWSIVSASGSAGAHLATGLGAVGQSAGSQAASEATRGNVSMGNLSVDNQRAGQSMMAPSMSSGHGSLTSSDGITNTITNGPGGGMVQSVPQHNFGVSADVNSAVKSGIQTKASNEVSQAYRATATSAQATVAALNAVTGQSDVTGTSSSVSTSGNTGASTKSGQQSTSVDAFRQNASNSLGFSESEATAVLASAAASLNSGMGKLLDQGGKAGSGAGFMKALGKFMPELRGSIQGKSDAQLNDIWGSAMETVKSDEFKNQLSTESSTGTAVFASQGTSTSSSNITANDASLSKVSSANQAAAQEVAEASRWQQASTQAQESGFSVGANVTAAVFSSLVGQQKSGVAVGFGGGGSTWSNSDVNELKQAAALGSPQAVAIFAQAAADYGAAEGLGLTGVQDAPQKPQLSAPEVSASGVEATHANNTGTIGSGATSAETVRANAGSVIDAADDRLNDVDAELGNQQQNIQSKSDALQADAKKNTDPERSTLKSATVGMINRLNQFD
jgi:conjugal transfer mating pair stabilization protein TraG